MDHSSQERAAVDAQVTRDPESPGQLVAGMASDAKHLAEQYVSLARIELTQATSSFTRLMTRVLIGSGLLVVGVLFLGIAIGYAAATFSEVPPWLTYGVLALAVLAAGALVIAAKSLARTTHDARTHALGAKS